MVYTLFYSPELNPVKYAFSNKMKKMAKQENVRSIFAGDMYIHAGIYACLNEISQQGIAGYYLWRNRVHQYLNKT